MTSRRRSAVWAAVAGSLGVAAVAVYLGSATYGLTCSLGQRYAVGVVAGAIMLQDREPRSGPVRTVPGLPPGAVMARPAPPYKHDAVHFYRHDFGFTWRVLSHAPTVGSGSRWIEIPLWIPLGTAAILIGGWTLHQWLRVPAGHCRFCRYDLHATAGPVCPECGAAAAVARKT